MNPFGKKQRHSLFMKEKFLEGDISSQSRADRVKELENNISVIVESRRYKLANKLAKFFGR